LAACRAPPGSDEKNGGTGTTLAPGGEWVPPGGLEQFCLEACGPCQAKMLLFFGFWCVVFN